MYANICNDHPRKAINSIDNKGPVSVMFMHLMHYVLPYNEASNLFAKHLSVASLYTLQPFDFGQKHLTCHSRNLASLIS